MHVLKPLAKIVVSTALLLAGASGCRTPDAESAVTAHGGTTVDNGRLVPLTLVLHYASGRFGVDLATHRAVDGVIAAAAADGLVVRHLEVWNGRAGASSGCVEFTTFAAITEARKKVCALAKAGNAKQGAPLTTYFDAYECVDDVIEAPTTPATDQGC